LHLGIARLIAQFLDLIQDSKVACSGGFVFSPFHAFASGKLHKASIPLVDANELLVIWGVPWFLPLAKVDSIHRPALKGLHVGYQGIWNG
jgi:hypothetical protein